MEKSGVVDTKAKVSSIFNLMRRLPPNQIEKSLAGIGSLIEDETLKQQIFDSVDQPLCKCSLCTL